VLLMIAALAAAQQSGPILSGEPAPTAMANGLFMFAPRLSGQDPGQVAFQAINLPAWMELVPASGVIYGCPGDRDAGCYEDFYLFASGRMASIYSDTWASRFTRLTSRSRA
jgi:hypothetical protein